MTFGDPLLLTLALFAVVLWFGRKPRTTVGHPSVAIHSNIRSMPLASRLPIILLTLAWLSLSVAAARPLLVESNERQSIETRDFIVTVDISSSMDGNLPAQFSQVEPVCPSQQSIEPQASETPDEITRPRSIARIDVARQAAIAFVDCRMGQGDRIGLIYFGGSSYPVAPLTTDLAIVRTQLELLGQQNEGDTNFDGPTRSNRRVGALQASLDHFDELGEADVKVLILITDGEDSIDGQRATELTQAFTERGIRVYVLGIGDTWTKGSTQALRRLLEGVGGTIIEVANAEQLREGFAQINELERSTVEVETYVDYQDIYQYFVALAVIFMAMHLIAASLTRQDA